MSRKLLTEIIAGLFILLFLYTALSKLSEFALFKHFLFSSPLIGKKAAIVAWVVPASEIIVSLLLFLPATRRLGLYASFILMLVFTLYLAYMIIFVPKLPCSCGGVISQLSWQQHLIFNVIFTILSVVGVRLYKAVPARNHVSLS